MMLIPCPHCGLRNEDEFVCWSEATPQRPSDPSQLSDAHWNDYIYNHTNPQGWSLERWFIRVAVRAGCASNVIRLVMKSEP